MGDNAEKRHQPVSPDQDIWNQQWSVEQAAEEFIYFDAYRGDFMQNSGLRVEDVMEIVFDESDELLWSPGLEEERQKQEELEKKKKRQGQ